MAMVPLGTRRLSLVENEIVKRELVDSDEGQTATAYVKRLTGRLRRKARSLWPALVWTADIDRPVFLPISRAVIPNIAKDRSRWSSASVHFEVPTRGVLLI